MDEGMSVMVAGGICLGVMLTMMVIGIAIGVYLSE